MEWSQWITKKYDEWREGKYGNAASIAEFARQFGAKHQIVLNWMQEGSNPPRKREYVNAIITLYGDEALEPLGIQERARPVAWGRLPTNLRDRLERATNEISDTLTSRGIEDPDSPEAKKVSDEIMGKYGFISTETSSEGSSSSR